jgi:hypothetical protein
MALRRIPRAHVRSRPVALPVRTRLVSPQRIEEGASRGPTHRLGGQPSHLGWPMTHVAGAGHTSREPAEASPHSGPGPCLPPCSSSRERGRGRRERLPAARQRPPSRPSSSPSAVSPTGPAAAAGPAAGPDWPAALRPAASRRRAPPAPPARGGGLPPPPPPPSPPPPPPPHRVHHSGGPYLSFLPIPFYPFCVYAALTPFHLYPTHNILPFIQWVLKLVVCVCARACLAMSRPHA